MGMVQRQSESNRYRYGFNGKEKDDEVKGEGNSIDFGARIYDSRLGKFLSLDPMRAKYAGKTPYHFGSDNPVNRIDGDGKDDFIFHTLTCITAYKIGDKYEYKIKTVSSVEVIRTNTANTYTAHNIVSTEDYTHSRNPEHLVTETSKNVYSDAGKYLSEYWQAIQNFYPQELISAGEPSHFSGKRQAQALKNSYEFDKNELETNIAALKVMSNFVPVVEFIAAANEVKLVTVGRWMSKVEYEAMQSSGRMVEGTGGQTYVVTSGPNAYKAAAKGSVYAEFQLSANSLIKGGKESWFKVLGPGAGNAMKEQLLKQGGEMLPKIKNLTPILEVK